MGLLIHTVVVGGGGGASMDSLSSKAASMRESLQKSQTITDNIVSILGSFDHRLSALETAMRPTQVSFITSFHFLCIFCFISFILMLIFVFF